ncbi:MAG: hypothetical protein AB7J35_17915 [Dehalococcoidia bacterium]
MKRLLILLVAAIVAIIPSAAFADSESEGGFVLRINGDYTLPAGQDLSNLVVINGDANVQGTVHNSVTVIRGDALVAGRVNGDVTVVRGDLHLANTAVVDNVRLVRGDLTRAQGATVTGSIDHTSGFFLRTGWAVLFGIVFFVGLGVALIAVAVGFGLIAGKQLGEAATSMGARPWQTIVSGLVTVVALPIIAAIAIATLVGFWIGLGIFLVLMPVLAVLGVAVAGTWIGLLVLNRGVERPARPVGAAALGTVILLVIFAIPGINVLALFAFATWGIGALTYMAIRGLRGPKAQAQQIPPVGTAQPSA